MNSKDLKKICDKKNSINRKINILKSFIKEFEINKKKLMDKCSDDVIILYINYLDKIGYVKYGKCLLCGKIIKVYNNNLENNINPENIIDLTNDEISFGDKLIFDNEFYKEIENKFKELISSDNIYTKDEIVSELRKLVNVKKLEKTK